MASPFLRTRLVSESEFWLEFRRCGVVYFIRNDEQSCVKIGHSREPWTRLTNLQVGSPNPLRMMGMVAARISIEPIIHDWHRLLRRQGEWFNDHDGFLSTWLRDVTYGEPLCRNVWDLVPGQEFFTRWDEAAQKHIKHVFDETLQQWVPPIP